MLDVFYHLLKFGSGSNMLKQALDKTDSTDPDYLRNIIEKSKKNQIHDHEHEEKPELEHSTI